VVVKEFPKKVDGKIFFRCQRYGHFQADSANIGALIINENKVIDQIH